MFQNFEKPLKELSDEELSQKINQSQPQFGILASDELTRRQLKNLGKMIEKNIDSIDKLERSTTLYS